MTTTQLKTSSVRHYNLALLVMMANRDLRLDKQMRTVEGLEYLERQKKRKRNVLSLSE